MLKVNSVRSRMRKSSNASVVATRLTELAVAWRVQLRLEVCQRSNAAMRQRCSSIVLLLARAETERQLHNNVDVGFVEHSIMWPVHVCVTQRSYVEPRYVLEGGSMPYVPRTPTDPGHEAP